MNDAGTDGGPAASCQITCSVELECSPTIDGGVCVPAYTLSFDSPTSGQLYAGPSAGMVNFSVSMRRIDGGVPSLGSIPLSVPGLATAPSMLNGSGGVYTGSANLPNQTRTFTATAGWAMAQATVGFSIDRLPPTVALEVLTGTGTGGAHLRDEVAPVRIRSNKPLSSSITLTLAGTDGGLTTQTAPVALAICSGFVSGGGPNDACGTLDLSLPAFSAGLSANFTAAVTATDTGGNSGSATLTFPVTRLRWRASIAAPVQVRAAPALDNRGNLYIGTQDLLGTGRLVSFSPSGVQRFATSVGAVQSVAVTETDVSGAVAEVAYVAVATGANSGALRMLNTTDGGLMAAFASVSSCLEASRSTSSAIALFDGGTLNGFTETAAVMVFNPNPVAGADTGRLCTFGSRSGGVTAVGDLGTAQPTPDGSLLLSPANIVVSGDQAYFQRPDNTLNYVTLKPLASGGASGGYGGLGAIPTGLAIGGATLVGAWVNASTNRPLATWQLPGAPSTLVTVNNTLWSYARAPAVLSGAVITETEEALQDWAFSMTLVGTGLGTPVGVLSPSSSSFSDATTPVIGTGTGGNLRAYLVNRSGELFVYDGATASGGIANLGVTWRAPLFATAGQVIAHPTLDCNRGWVPGRPGTLYVVALDGQVTAVIVDSTRLDPTTPWPKWQRTAGNSGNTAFELNPGCSTVSVN